jgi:hypothetical protein
MNPDDATTEQARVNEVVAGVLRAWLVTHDPDGSPSVPVEWLRSELYALRETYPGDRRTTHGLGYCTALVDVHHLLDRAADRQPPA